MTTTPPRIDPRLGAAALRAPAASREDSRPQAILKFHRPSSLDYRARHGLPVGILLFEKVVSKKKIACTPSIFVSTRTTTSFSFISGSTSTSGHHSCHGLFILQQMKCVSM